jgi:hypothetical protein
MKTAFAFWLLLICASNNAHSDVYATLTGDTTRIWDTSFDWSCTGRFSSITRISHDTIYVTERDTIWLATCMCYFDVCTKLTGLQPGSYFVLVTRRHEEHREDTIYVFEELAGTTNFTIINPTVLLSNTLSYQSPCRDTPQSVFHNDDTPNHYLVLTNHPNPFNPNTIIQFSLPYAAFINLTVYNMLGQPVATLLKERRLAGTHAIVFQSRGLPSGIYVCRLSYGTRQLSTKLVLQK